MEIQGFPDGGRVRKTSAGRPAGSTTGVFKTTTAISRHVDKFELAAPTGTKNIALDSIKAKIASGFYNSDAVADDVSDRLARLFDR